MVLFLLLAIVAVVSGVAMITARNSIHSALFLVVNFFCLAVLYLTLNAEFLAVLQIVVYAGAIMVLFLFVITLLNPGREELNDRLSGQRTLSVVFGLALLVEVALLLRSPAVRDLLGPFPAATSFAAQVSEQLSVRFAGPVGDLGNVQAVGFALYTNYLLPFEVISLVLLLAVIGAIFLAKREFR